MQVGDWCTYVNVVDSAGAFETDLVVRNVGERSTIDLDVFGRHFIAECKNWTTTVGVAHVGYFLYRLRLTQSIFGVLFAKSGITGDDTPTALKNARALIRRAFDQDGIACAVVAGADIDRLVEGETTIVRLLLRKVEEIRFGRPLASA